ncbi:hypothetical protein DFH06DRAFT_1313313 [Mycena polygramma]|nr:hypothetical protein DFH06DRAFT_1313313 [Mycena polygramma]
MSFDSHCDDPETLSFTDVALARVRAMPTAPMSIQTFNFSDLPVVPLLCSLAIPPLLPFLSQHLILDLFPAQRIALTPTGRGWATPFSPSRLPLSSLLSVLYHEVGVPTSWVLSITPSGLELSPSAFAPRTYHSLLAAFLRKTSPPPNNVWLRSRL